MALAKPKLTTVWPGSDSITEPEGERRRVADEVLTAADVRRAIGESAFAEEKRYSARDLRLLRQAWRAGPGRREGNVTPQHEARGPEIF
jgi:hypothetical protein